MTRYARQISVPELGPAGQDRLRAARVLVIGAGGLAAPVLQYLAGAGAGFLRVVDPDRVARSNLHRQTLFAEADAGARRPKVLAAAERIAALNGDCRIEPVADSLRPGNVARLCAGVDLVLDCADSFAVSYVLSDHCRAAGLPLISASVVGTDGYCGGFCGPAPSLRAVFPDLPQRLGSCAEDGVLGPAVGIVGAVQAQMALAVLTGLQPSPLGRLVTVAALTLRFGGFRFDGAAEPEGQARFIDPAELAETDFIVDLRAPEEGPLPHPAARRLDPAGIGPGMPLPAPGQRAVLCCRSGFRSWQAADRLARLWDGDIALVALGDATGEPE